MKEEPSGIKFFGNLGGIKATVEIGDPNWGKGTDDPNQGGDGQDRGSTSQNRENSQLRFSRFQRVGDSISVTTPPIGVAGALPLIGAAAPSVASIPSKLTENLTLC
ncbi:hypothetical protein CRG98_010929 [Punica granatum]|uniref:Uncharacterized protein n=1 Tax=Punica granatum TaxID=22663 RepID=A0A2I0KJM3_PUNGR|nr:hypothetical protein CRG98_010929 [Punica granatum]